MTDSQASPFIVEIALTCQFAIPQPLNVLDAADIRELFSADFPIFQQVPRQPPLVVGPQQVGFFSFETAPEIGLPRLWFISSDSSELVQIQDDRLSYNWRRTAPLNESCNYPGFIRSRERFLECFSKLSGWCAQKWGTPPTPHITELLYANSIPLIVNGTARRLSEVFSYLNSMQSGQLINFSQSWFEFIEPPQAGFARVAVQGMNLPTGEAVCALNIEARQDVSAFPDPESWFESAHMLCGEIYRRSINEAVR